MTSDYTKRYTDSGDLYNMMEYGSPGVSKGLRFSQWIIDGKKTRKEKVLCVGFGEGYELVNYLKNGFNAFGTELHTVNVPYLKGRILKALVPNLPFKDNTFDFLSCTEVLEHIDEKETDGFLTECKRVAKEFFFSIATSMDPFNSHINLHEIDWWYKKFVKAGFEITNIQFRPIFEFLGQRGWFSEGVTVIASKDI